jgi:DNA (cytosine-5)-methyltransferase 1
MTEVRFGAHVRDPVVKVIDLFCGAGGLAYGLKSAGLTIAAGVDLDPRCEYPFVENCGGEFAEKSVADLQPEDLQKWFGDADVRVLAGCAPCQPFSSYSQSRKSVDERWMLLNEFNRLAVAVKPEIVTMENVRGLASQSVWKGFVKALRDEGYAVEWAQVDCTDYGIPQSRTRLVLLASLLGPIKLQPPSTSATRTVKDAIGALPRIEAGSADPADPLHAASSLSETNMERIKVSVPGGTWREWPAELRAGCHTRPTGKTYPAVYGRMEWGKPAPTITTQCFGFGNGRFGHPEQDRAISLREAALLQSFPAEYKFVRPTQKISFTSLGTLIGNAVPPKLGEAIGSSILDHLERVRAGPPPSDGELHFS